RDERAEDNHPGEEAVEDRRFADLAGDAVLPAEGVGDGEGGAERQDAGGEERGAEEADREEDKGVAAGERLERPRRLGGRLELGRRDSVDRRAGGDDDESRDEDREGRADDDLGALVGVLA